MLKAPSLVNIVQVPYSGDPALNLPGIKAAGALLESHREAIKSAKAGGASDHELAELRAKNEAEAAAARPYIDKDRATLEAAKETGDYSKIVSEGAKPTWFHLRIIPGSAMREIYAAMNAGEVSAFKQPAIAFRCAITKIEPIEGVTLKFEDDPKYGKIATDQVVDDLDRIDPAIITELGYYALGRSSPKGG